MAERMGAQPCEDGFCMQAFGEVCRVTPEGIRFEETLRKDPQALLISLYAMNACQDPTRLKPFKSFKELPGSMPYQAAFSANAERILVPHVPVIHEESETIKMAFDGFEGEDGDFSLVLYPFPKMALYYIFYMPDDEFPASATTLFSANALSFMPLDGLADVAEYTSKKIIAMVR
ncbi:MAG: DUF3786 domain-containing protein [Deltaproteobacteria bacterium]|nr:DUF3786 domain-containing protein [Deltaproteobacteria bacterium]